MTQEQEFAWQKAIESTRRVEEFRRRALYLDIEKIQDLFSQEGEFRIFEMPLYARIYLGFVPMDEDQSERIVGGPYRSMEEAQQELEFVNFLQEAKNKFQQEHETGS